MGAKPKQHDAREAEHDQLSIEALTSDALAQAPSRRILSNSRASADKKVIGLWRTGAALVVFFELIYAIEQHYASPSTFDATLSLHLTNIAIGVVFFLSSFTPAMPRYWRQLTLFVCIALLVSTTAICTTSIRVEGLFVSVLVIVVGAGTLAPWDWRWQAAVSSVGMSCFYMLGRAHGIVESDPSMYWLGVMTAVGLGQSNVYLQTRNRRAIAQNLDDRLSSDQKLTDSEEKFRQIFQQSGDMVVVNNLDTGAILEVNNQFVKRSRVPRELVVGRMDTDFNFFAEPAARDQFMKDLHQSGVVKNFEVQLNGLGYDRPMPALISAVAVRLNNEHCAIIVVREISDVREAERKLRNSETTLRKIFDANLDSVTTTDAVTRRYTDVNHEFCRSTGFSREEVLGKTYWEIGVWPSREESDNFSAAMIRNGEVRNMKADFYAKDGTLIPCLMSGTMVELDGKLSVLTITRNIGDLLAAEQKLKESEASLRKIFDSILDPLSITDLEGRFVDVNDEFLRLSEFSREEIIGTISPGVTDNHAAGTESEYRESLGATGQARNFEVTIRTKGGVEIPVLLSSVVVELGGELRVVTIARDITRLKEQERKLQSSEAMLREIFDSSVDNIAVTDLSDGIIIDVNNELVRSLGLAKDEIVGKRFEQLNVWENIEQLALFTATLLKQREVRNFETTFRTVGGSTFPALISAVVLELGGRECALSIARDITDLEAARKKALAASKAKTEFLSSMPHEIRTPMNAILGMADLIGESDLDSEQRRYLDTIISNGNALLELINSILDLARVESGRMNLEAVAFDVVELTEKVADTLAVRAHEKGIELAVRFSANLPATLVGDSLRLRQVLTNLIGNAIKFTERGEVVIDVARNPGQPNPGSLLFSVRDSGIGMPTETLPNIFSAFTQADSSTTRKYGGSGLGLTIVERLVALMGGKVRVESELGAGSTFHFTVELGLPPEGETRERRGPDLTSIRALVVDDNETNRSIVSRMLGDSGAIVTEAKSGAEALAAFSAANRDGAPFGLLLVDLQMPVMDGLELIRKMRLGSNGNVPIVMLVTSNGLSTRLNAIRELGVNHYVVKPVKRHDLYAAISGAIAEVAGPVHPAPVARDEVALNGAGKHLLDRPLSILLADDSPDNRLLITAYLKKSGYAIDEVEDGQAALDHFMTRAYDVVLMDIQMPVLDGYSSVRKIRQWEAASERGRTPIIALSAAALEADVRRAIEVGCDMHVSKPVKKSTLLKAIAQVVGSAALDDASPEPVRASEAGTDPALH